MKLLLIILFFLPIKTIDTTDPAIMLITPQTESVYNNSNIITFKSIASDDVGVVVVYYIVDNIVIGSSTKTPYKITLNASAIPIGRHIVGAVAEDAAGNRGVLISSFYTQ